MSGRSPIGTWRRPDLLAVYPPHLYCMALGRIVRAAVMDIVGSFFYFGSPEPELSFGRLGGITTRTTQTERFFRRQKALMKAASLSLGASQRQEVRKLLDLLKPCFLVGSSSFRGAFFFLSPVTKFGSLDGSVPSFGGKAKSR